MKGLQKGFLKKVSLLCERLKDIYDILHRFDRLESFRLNLAVEERLYFYNHVDRINGIKLQIFLNEGFRLNQIFVDVKIINENFFEF